MPYKFMRLADNDDQGKMHSSICVSIPERDADLHELLKVFEDFLRGCGHVFEGRLVIFDERDN